MTEYEFTETAKEDLDHECSECGETEFPELVDAEEADEYLVDYIVTVECVNCGIESKTKVWERDLKTVLFTYGFLIL